MTIYQVGPLRGRRTGQIPRTLIIVSALVLMGNVLTTNVQAQTVDEYRVKAAFILNFAKFVDWPSDTVVDGGALVVGIVGDDPFGSALDQLNGYRANGRRLRIKRFRSGEDLRGCQIVFISNSEERNLWKILGSIKGTSVLTIGETPQFNHSGGMIRFVIQNNRVRFEINAAAAGQARLRISSKLLALSNGGN